MTGRSAERGAFGKARCIFGIYVLIMGAVLDDTEVGVKNMKFNKSRLGVESLRNSAVFMGEQFHVNCNSTGYWTMENVNRVLNV